MEERYENLNNEITEKARELCILIEEFESINNTYYRRDYINKLSDLKKRLLTNFNF